MEISIVTSGYNAEKTIEQTINSVLDQSFYEFEYIIVNHGSTDSTGEIIEKYRLTDSRISVANILENTGKIGKAINLGIELASGKYITFLDADDVYNQDYLKVMYENITKSDYDLAVCGSLRMNEDGKEFMTDTLGEDAVFCNDHNYAKLPSFINDIPTRYFTVWWNKLYRMQYLKEHALQMSESTLVHGDALFNLEMLLRKPKMYCSKFVGTKWRQTQGSVSFGTYKKGYCDEIMDVCEKYFKLYVKCGASDEELEVLAKKLLATVATIKRLKNYKASKQELAREIENWRNSNMFENMVKLSGAQRNIQEICEGLV